MQPAFDGLDDHLVDQFQCRRNNSSGDDAADPSAGSFNGGEILKEDQMMVLLVDAYCEM